MLTFFNNQKSFFWKIYLCFYKNIRSTITTLRPISSPLLVLVSAAVLGGCSASKDFWQYVVEDRVVKPIPVRENGEEDAPRMLSPHNVRVVYSDGSTSTEVVIPVLTAGQQIVIDHKSRSKPSSLAIVPLPPGASDKSLEQSYVEEGHPIQTKSPPVSIVKTHERIRELVQEGNYGLALEFADQLLKRYPKHVKTLRTKGSLLLQLGEREAALKAYIEAQEIEPDSKVEDMIKKIEDRTSEKPSPQ